MVYSRMRASLGAAIGITLALGLALAGCADSQSTTSDRPQSLVRAQYHFSLTIAAGWLSQQENEDPTANTPYSVTIGFKHPPAGASPSLFNLQVTKTTTPGIAQNIAALSTNPAYRSITISGMRAYVQTTIAYDLPPTLAPGQTDLPAATPAPGTTGTVTHSDYEVPTSAYLFTIDTDAIAGQNADAALNSMLQSLSIQS